MTLNVGDRIKDNDPRMGNRVLVVAGLEGEKVRAGASINSRSFTHISIKRIHTDGKPRRSGWSLVQESAE